MNKIVTTSKQRLARQFGKAARTYNDAAQVQLDIAFDLLQLLPQKLGVSLDLGSGTGRITEHLASRSQRTLGVDLAFEMVSHSARNMPQIEWLNGDAEHLPIQSGSVDTVFSSMALQWCQPIDSAMTEIARVLKPAGKAYLAILSENAMFELASCWARIDDCPRVNNFDPQDVLKKAAVEAGLGVSSLQKNYQTWHSNVKILLNSIRHIGANMVTETSNRKPLNRNSLEILQQVYQQHYGNNGALPLTYKVVLMELTK